MRSPRGADRPVLTLAVLALLAGAAPLAGVAGPAAAQAADPQARTPDLSFEGEVTAVAVGDGVLVGTRDPGSRFVGGDPMGLGPYPDAVVWHAYDAAGRPERSGRADYYTVQDTCEDRLGDDCRAHVTAVALSGDGSTLVIASSLSVSPTDMYRGMVQVIDRDLGLRALLFFPEVPGFVGISDDGSRLVVAGSPASPASPAGDSETRIRFFHLNGTTSTAASTLTTPGTLRAAAAAPGGQDALVVAAQAVRANAATGSVLVHGAADAVALSESQSHWGVLGAASGQVSLVRQETAAPVFSRTPGSAVGAVAIAPDVSAFAAGDDAGRIHLFRTHLDRTPLASLAATVDLGQAGVTDLAWSGDSVLLAAAAGATVHLFQAGSNLTKLWSDTLPGPALTVAASRDGSVVAAAWAGGVRVYDPKLDLTGEAAPLVVEPRGAGEVEVRYTNTGNRAVEATLSLRTPPGWNLSLSQAAIDVPVGVSRTVTVSVGAPTDGEPANATAWVDHVLPDGRKGATEIVLTVPTVRDVQAVSVGPTSAAIVAGGSQRFRLEVSNLGNVDEDVRIEIESTPGWAARASLQEIALAPAGTRVVDLDLEAPADAVEGANGTLTVRAAGHEVTYTAAVGARFALGLTAPAEVPFTPGNITAFKIQVRNLGNIVDSYVLSLTTTPPPGWIIQFPEGGTETEVRGIPPGGNALVEVRFAPPRDLPANGVLNLAFTATSMGVPDRSADARTTLVVTGVEPTDRGSPTVPWPAVAAGVLAAAFVAARRRQGGAHGPGGAR